MTKQQQFILGLLLIALVVLILEETVDPWLEVDHEPSANIYRDTRSFSTPYAVSGTASATTTTLTTTTLPPELV